MTRPDVRRTLHALAAAPRRIAATVALVFAIVAVGPLAAPTALAWDANTFSSGSESQLISLQNQARASAGLRSLKLDSALRTIARWRSKDMIDRDYFSHTIKGTTHNVFWYMQYKYGYCFKVAGENIGTVTWPGASEADATNWIFEQFMNSSGHRANIMGKAWDVVAVGAYKTTGDRFMWTVLFADSCSSTPAATSKPTPKPTPRATPRPTVRPTPRPTPHPTSRPTPRTTAEPTASPSPTPEPTEPVATPEPTEGESPGPTEAPPTEPTEPGGAIVPPGQLRIMDVPADQGLVDSILGAITAQFFGR